MKTIQTETVIVDVLSAEKKHRNVNGVERRSMAVVLPEIEGEYANSGRPFNKRIFEDAMPRAFNHLLRWLDKEGKKTSSPNDFPTNGNGQPLRFKVEFAIIPTPPHYRFRINAEGKVDIDKSTKITKIRACAFAGVESVDSQYQRYIDSIPAGAKIATSTIPDADDVDTAGESQATGW